MIGIGLLIIIKVSKIQMPSSMYYFSLKIRGAIDILSYIFCSSPTIARSVIKAQVNVIQRHLYLSRYYIHYRLEEEIESQLAY